MTNDERDKRMMNAWLKIMAILRTVPINRRERILKAALILTEEKP